MTAVKALAQMLSQLKPELRPGRYVFVTVTGAPSASLHPIMSFREDEGETLIVRQREADGEHLGYDLVTAWITLTIHSALDGVGLTAAVSGALAGAGISCNMVAAAFHDHLFVPADRADDAIRVLTELSAAERTAG